MNVRINRATPYKLNAAQKRALDKEAERQLVEKRNEFLKDMDAMMLLSLHRKCGFGKRKLTEIFKSFILDYDRFIDDYQMEGAYIAAYKLKEETGLDIDELHKELGLQ